MLAFVKSSQRYRPALAGKVDDLAAFGDCLSVHAAQQVQRKDGRTEEATNRAWTMKMGAMAQILYMST